MTYAVVLLDGVAIALLLVYAIGAVQAGAFERRRRVARVDLARALVNRRKR